jgi:hypothetical protein
MASRSEICAGHGNEFQKYLENAESAAANEFPNSVWEFVASADSSFPKHCLGIHDSVIRPGNTVSFESGFSQNTLSQKVDPTFSQSLYTAFPI